MRVWRLIVLSLLSCSLAVAGAEAGTLAVDGRSYVELSRAAAELRGRIDAGPDSVQARLKAGDHVVTLTRNWSRVLVDGAPVVLDAPVRVRKGVWLVPAGFVARLSPRLLPAPPPAARMPNPNLVALEELRVRSYPSFTRIVVETALPLAFRVESQATRETRIRLVGLAAEPRVEQIGDGIVSDARLERAGADAILRVSFTGAAGELRSSMLADPPRVVLDFVRPDDGTPRDRAEGQAPLRVIVLDAGHGGNDSGAVGPGGLMEKDVVLDVTRRVARLLEDRLEVKVLLSRDGDHFVPLGGRTSFANRERADLFVSIHANAHREAASQGLETYFLSSEATDGSARQVAAAENAVVQLERPAARGRVDLVKTILWDLAQSEYQAESSRVAEIVLDSMTQALQIPNRGVKQADFYVLGGAAMPAILIEIGFLTNPREERRLRDPRYRDDIARAIFAGLAEYKQQWDRRARAEIAPARARSR